MNAFEKGFQRGIPLEKAASFFCGLKTSGRQMSAEDDALLATAIKEAADPTPVPAPPPPGVKEASASFDALVRLYKCAGDDGMPASSDALTAPTSKKDDSQTYLANEAEAQAAEDQGSVEYYQQQLQMLREETSMANQRAEEAEAARAELEATQASHEQQIAAASQEGQIAQQAAMQQVNAANTMASQAMQSAVDASNKALEAKATETTAKIQQQGLRTQLFDMASEGLPGTEPQLGGAGDASEGLAPTSDVAVPPGAAPADPAAGGAEGDGAPAEAPGGGMNEAGEAMDTEGMQGDQPAPEAVVAEGAPDAVPPGGDVGAPGAPPAAPAAQQSPPSEDPAAKRQGQVSIKVGSDARAKVAAGLPEYLRRPEIIGALAGGVGGAGAAAMEASGHGPDLGALKQRVDEGEQSAAQPGVKGFVQAFQLAKDKAMHTLGEATQNHPVAATITGGLIGAGAGYSAGPHLKSLVDEAAALHRG